MGAGKDIPKKEVFLLLKSETVQILGEKHYVRAWRVEKKRRSPGYEFSHFALTHSDQHGQMLLQMEYKEVERLGDSMADLLKNLRLTFTEPNVV